MKRVIIILFALLPIFAAAQNEGSNDGLINKGSGILYFEGRPNFDPTPFTDASEFAIDLNTKKVYVYSGSGSVWNRYNAIDTLSTLADTTNVDNRIGQLVYVNSVDQYWHVQSDGFFYQLETGGGGTADGVTENIVYNEETKSFEATVSSPGSNYSFSAREALRSLNPDFYVSKSGDDSNSGRTPAKSVNTIDTIIARSVSLSNPVIGLEDGLYRGKISSANFNKKATFTRYDINSLFLSMPEISAYNVVKNFDITTLTNTYKKTGITHDGSEPSNVYYDYITVIEVDTALEKSHPYSARKMLTYVNEFDTLGVSQLEGTYTFDRLAEPFQIYIHPSDSQHPDSSKYRYEVSVRTNVFSNTNTDSLTIDGLLMFGGSQGYGALAAGDYTTLKNSVIGAGITHHAVLKSGQVDNNLFFQDLEEDSVGVGAAIVFYESNALGNFAYLRNNIFMDVHGGAYAHKGSGADDHELFLMDGNYYFGHDRQTDIRAIAFATSADVKKTVFTNNYIEEAYRGFTGASEDTTVIVGNVFHNARVNVTSASSHFVLFKNNILDTYFDNTYAFNPAAPTHLTLINGTSFVENNIARIGNANQASGELLTLTGQKKKYNVIISNAQRAVIGASATSTGTVGETTDPNVVSDYNVYIDESGNSFVWQLFSPPSGCNLNNFNLSDWQTCSGQDQNSIYIDISSDPDGLKEIYLDPDNGDWRLNPNGMYYDTIVSIGAGVLTPISAYPKKPDTYEDAISIIQGKENIKYVTDDAVSGGEITATDNSDGTYQIERNGQTILTIDTTDSKLSSYDNSVSGLAATNTKDAIDEVNAKAGLWTAFSGTQMYPTSFRNIGLNNITNPSYPLHANAETYIRTDGAVYARTLNTTRGVTFNQFNPALPALTVESAARTMFRNDVGNFFRTETGGTGAGLVLISENKLASLTTVLEVRSDDDHSTISVAGVGAGGAFDWNYRRDTDGTGQYEYTGGRLYNEITDNTYGSITTDFVLEARDTGTTSEGLRLTGTTLKLAKYGSANKTSSVLSKTKSGMYASFATDGTILEDSITSTDITVTDAGGYFTGTNQEAVNQEIGSKLQNISALSHNVTTGTTDVNGDITILHGLGATPTTVIITGGTNADRTYQVLEASKTSTQFTVRVYDAGTPVNAGSVTFNWIAIQ